MDDLKNIEIIDRYLDGALDKSEKQKFENRLATDPAFHQTFDEVQEAILAIKLAGEDRLWVIMQEEQAKLSAISYQPSAVSYQPSAISHASSAISYQPSAITHASSAISYQLSAITRKKRFWLAAASIALLATVGYWFLMPSNKPSFTFQAKDNTWINSMRDFEASTKEVQKAKAQYGTEEGQKLVTGLKLYEKNQFNEAATVLLSIHLQNDTLLLYQANALIMANRNQEAINILNKIPDNAPNSMEKDWYLAHAYWSNKNIEQSKTIFTNIAHNPQHDWHEQAEKKLHDYFK